MAIRFLLCACLLSAASSAPSVNSEHEFKTTYDTYIVNKDAAAVKNANANIVGSAIPDDPDEKEMNRWYHEVNTGVQAEAKALMDKAHVAKPARQFPIAGCISEIHAAQEETSADTANWDKQYIIYNRILAEKVETTTPAWTAKQKQAWSCLNALSGEQKELATQVGVRAKLFDIFKTGCTAAPAGTSMLLVSQFVSGTLASSAPTAAPKGLKTQPMYSQADAPLKREMMQYMVTLLNAQLPA